MKALRNLILPLLTLMFVILSLGGCTKGDSVFSPDSEKVSSQTKLNFIQFGDAASLAKGMLKDTKVVSPNKSAKLVITEGPKYAGRYDDDDDYDDYEEDDDEDNPHEEEMQMYSVENGQYPALEQMQKQISQLTKAFKGQTNLKKMVQGETEGRLRKMGFREETSLTRPTMIRYEDSFGVDGTTPITKTADSPDDMVAQMMNMSYKDLRVLQERIESGETEGIPREFIG